MIDYPLPGAKLHAWWRFFKIFKKYFELSDWDGATYFAHALFTFYDFVIFWTMVAFWCVVVLTGWVLINFGFVSPLIETGSGIIIYTKRIIGRREWVLASPNWLYTGVGDEKLLDLRVADVGEWKVLELIWGAVPLAILAILFMPSLTLTYWLDSAVDPAFTVGVSGRQWYWEYKVRVNLEMVGRYNDEVFMRLPWYKLWLFYINNTEVPNPEAFFKGLKNEDNFMIYAAKKSSVAEPWVRGSSTKRLLEVTEHLAIPVGIPLRFLITSHDVLHSFSVPSLGFKLDAVPGRVGNYSLLVTRPGVFYGQCSELCGVLHGFMPIVVEAVSSIDFIGVLMDIFSKEDEVEPLEYCFDSGLDYSPDLKTKVTKYLEVKFYEFDANFVSIVDLCFNRLRFVDSWLLYFPYGFGTEPGFVFDVSFDPDTLTYYEEKFRLFNEGIIICFERFLDELREAAKVGLVEDSSLIVLVEDPSKIVLVEDSSLIVLDIQYVQEYFEYMGRSSAFDVRIDENGFYDDECRNIKD